MKSNPKIAVIGSGSWGTALALQLSILNRNITLYSRTDSIVESINKFSVNHNHLPDINLGSLKAEHISNFQDSEIIINTIPTQFIKSFYQQYDFLSKDTFLINGSKGIELESDYLIHEIFEHELRLNSDRYCVLTGPSHAEEVAKQKATAIIAASKNHALSEFTQDLFSSENFRVYASDDVEGAELGGALKNVIALASGILSGLDLGDNSNAALLTRGLAEIMRLGEALGGNRITFAGLSGLGDLFVTCSSKFSRNRKAGELIAKGNTVSEIEENYNFVAEGIYTAKSALDLAQKHNIEIPIIEEVNQILFDNKDPESSIRDLMNRDKRREFLI